MLLFVGATSFVGKNFSALYWGKFVGTYCQSDFTALEGSGVMPQKMDLTDYDEVCDVFRNNNIDKVILASAVIYAKDEKGFSAVNISGVSNLLRAMSEFGVNKIVYLSTAVLYNDEKVWGEYGKTKKAAEQLIIDSGFDYIILRPAEIYGPMERQGLGKLINYTKQHKIIPLINGGKNLLAPIHVEDVCEILGSCIDNDIFDKKIYLLAGGQTLSLREFASLVSRRLNKNTLLFSVPLGLARLASIVWPGLVDREQIMRAVNTLSFDPKETEARFGFKFRRLDLSYLGVPQSISTVK